MCDQRLAGLDAVGGWQMQRDLGAAAGVVVVDQPGADQQCHKGHDPHRRQPFLLGRRGAVHVLAGRRWRVVGVALIGCSGRRL